MENFNTGDSVKLKSGGPLMTVQSVTGEDVCCVWFDENNKVASATFTRNMLEKPTRRITR